MNLNLESPDVIGGEVFFLLTTRIVVPHTLEVEYWQNVRTPQNQVLLRKQAQCPRELGIYWWLMDGSRKILLGIFRLTVHFCSLFIFSNQEDSRVARPLTINDLKAPQNEVLSC